MVSLVGLVAGALALAVIVIVFITILKGIGRSGLFPIALVIVLALLWLGSTRHSSRQIQTQQSWTAQHQRDMSDRHAALAKNMAQQQAQRSKQLAQSQARLVEQQANMSVDNFAIKTNSNFDGKQQWVLQPPQVIIPPTPVGGPPMPSASLAPPAPVSSEGPVVIEGDPATWLMLTPVVLIAATFVGFLASRRAHRGAVGSGLGWLAAGVAILVLMGFFFTGLIRKGEVIPGRVMADDSTVRVRQIGRPSAVYAEASEDAHNRESIDAIWERLSAPQIKLDVKYEPAESAPAKSASAESKAAKPKSPDQVTAAQAKLNAAAEALELAAERMTESNSQGWLVVMADALLKATAKKAELSKPAAKPVKVIEAAKPAAAAQSYAEASPKPAGREPEPKSFPRSELQRRMPDWVVHHPSIVGDVRKFVVEGGPYKTLGECHRDLEDKMRTIVQDRVIDLASTATGGRASVPTLQAMGIGTDYILRELCTEEYVETNEYDFGDMLTAHALMEFNAAQDSALLEHWKAYARRNSVKKTVLGAGMVVGCLALAFGLLKVDTWTRGYYTKRLFLGVPAAIIAVVVLMTLA